MCWSRWRGGWLCEGRRWRRLTEPVGRMTAVRFPQSVIYRQLNITSVNFLDPVVLIHQTQTWRFTCFCIFRLKLDDYTLFHIVLLLPNYIHSLLKASYLFYYTRLESLRDGTPKSMGVTVTELGESLEGGGGAGPFSRFVFFSTQFLKRQAEKKKSFRLFAFILKCPAFKRSGSF